MQRRTFTTFLLFVGSAGAGAASLESPTVSSVLLLLSVVVSVAVGKASPIVHNFGTMQKRVLLSYAPMPVGESSRQTPTI